MKIVCDNCATKYSIADEKVRGKVFKIRCKKCSHIIVVKGTEGDAPVEAGAAADAAPAEPDPSGEGWHVVVNGEQVGPLASTDVRSKFAAGEIDAETFAWKEGFGDWQRLASIDEFRDLQPAAPAVDMTRKSGSPTADDLFGGGETTTGNNDLFGGSAGGDLFAGSAASAAAAPAAGAGLFAQPAASEAPRRAPTPGFGTPVVDAAPAAQSAAPAAVSGGKGLTGQRNENSVLFSLNNLQALASGGSANKPSASSAAASSGGVDNRPGFANSQTEGSGLIDIRAMAAATLSTPSPSSSSNNDIPSFSSAPVFSPIAAPILMPSAASGPPKWLWPVVAVGGLGFIAMMAVLVAVLMKKPETVAVAPAATAPAAAVPVAGTPAAPGAAVPVAATPTATPAAAATPTAAAATPAAADKHGAKGSAPAKGGKADKAPGTKVAKADVPAAAAPTPAPVAAPAPPPKKKSGGGDDLDDLLNGATGHDKPSKASHESAPAADENLPEQLDKNAIVSGMGGVKSRVSDCYHQFNVPGIANVAVTIGKNGHISSANVTGALAGTPTADCVTKAVKSASFPKFSGAPQSITYPFMLR